ncbi:MAG: SEC-C metal-binding domain-containing protein [Bosea sp. (in: a-proteobacteria)]
MNPNLVKNNYIKVDRFFEPDVAKALSDEFYRLEKEGGGIRDAQSPKATSAYNHLPFIRKLVEKVPHVSELLGEPVLPTYVYGRIYRTGNDLPRHRDRPACEISLTVNLSQDGGWPIFMQKPNGKEAAVDLDPGQAILYLGCDADHWREAFTGKEMVQIFMHYVRANGDRAGQFFDLEGTKQQALREANAARPTVEPPQPRPPVFVNPLARFEQVPRFSAPDYAQMNVPRNGPCPCGSGMRFKHCHGKALPMLTHGAA